MTGRWRCQRCCGETVKTQLLAVGGGIKEARKLDCESCGESDHYTLDLVSRNGVTETQRGKFRWMKNGNQQEAMTEMDPAVLEAVVQMCQRQRVFLQTSRYVALIGDAEYHRELAEIEECLKTLEALRGGQRLQAV